VSERPHTLVAQVPKPASNSETVIILAPLGRDGALAKLILGKVGMTASVCASATEACEGIDAGAGAVLVTQEAFTLETAECVVDALLEQPAWSDIPVVVLVGAGVSPLRVPYLRTLVDAGANVTVLERPVPTTTLVSTLQAALRARLRQYQVRDQFDAVARAEADERRALDRARHLQELTVQLGLNLDTAVLFAKIVDAVAALLDVTVVGLYLLERPDADFESVAARGLAPGQVGSRLPRHASLAGRAVDQRRSLAVNNVASGDDVVLPRLIGGSPVGAVAVAPILTEDQQLGAIEVYSPSPREWEPDDVELLTAIAAAVAVALTNVRHLEREQHEIEARDDFLAAASHDLKNPLTVIRGSIQMLERTRARTGELPRERLDMSIRTISGSAARMTALIEELLDVARLRMGNALVLEKAPTDLVALAGHLVAIHQSASETHTLVVDARVPELVGVWDERRLQRVLDNLLSNAIKYSPGGEIRVGVSREGESAVLTVQDRGIGIPEADLPHVFERFRRGANVLGRIDGTGIGLAAAAQIIREHTGSIDLYSREGEGTLVTVRLPLSTDLESQ
jgi:signal transduction histidine kinase